MKLSKTELIKFILSHSFSLKKEVLENLSITELVMIKTQIEIDKNDSKK